MRSIEYARAKGRDARGALDGTDGAGGPSGLLDRLVAHLENAHGLNLVALSSAQMKSGDAELNARSRVIKYDAALRDDERLMRFAHELGHLVLHQRLRTSDTSPDPLSASAYGAAGTSAIARYSPRTYEEVQAEAFALELVAPSDAVWGMWRDDEAVSVAAIAAHFGCSVNVIHTQLAHALHAVALGGTVPSASRKTVLLTPVQLAAARFTGAPAIVDAGPGTGKTATVIERIRYLLNGRARPSGILALTFSNEAAQELSERVAAAFSADVADALNVRTFHGFGVEFLHLHGHHVGLGERLELLDEDRQRELVSALLGRVACDEIVTLRDPRETAERVVQHINYCKQRLYDVAALDAATAAWAASGGDEASCRQARQLVELFRAYEEEKWRVLEPGDDAGGGRAQARAQSIERPAQARAQCIDFADLIALPIRILESHVGVRAEYARRLPWVIVDEFQDVTRATSRLLRALCGERNPPWVVGDARQSIYQFLGAAPENVTAFARDFENAHVFALDVNYRSSEPVVTAANQLAALLEDDAATADTCRARWTAGTDAEPLGATPVSIADAATDAAEANGVASRVREWIERDGVVPGDIAVLCRRHVDVRNVILELSRRGITAQASGVLTAEGAAGDLAAMVTLADGFAASIPRVAFALGREREPADELNAIIGELLGERLGELLGERLREHRDRASSLTGGATNDEDHSRRDDGNAGGCDVRADVRVLHETLKKSGEGADGFTALATILFDATVYLRRVLSMPECAERQMALVEIVSVLSLATAYRATHLDVPPAAARLEFAEQLRVRLTETLPVPLSPRPRTDAVHVMTCHASKGLEFPCVAVVGQNLPGVEEKWPWLPPAIRPDASRELSQADALLFVGVTRAKRSVLVSSPRTATASPRSRKKAIVPVLQRWRETFGVPVEEWSAEHVSDSPMSIGNIWNVPRPRAIKVSALDAGACPVLTYLETYAGARFPEATRALYPSWFAGVRRALRGIVATASETGAPASDSDARILFEAEWPEGRHADHPHGALYRSAAERMVGGFAGAFRPLAALGVRELEMEIVVPSPEPDGLDMQLDLIARYRRGSDGRVVTMAFRPETLASASKDGRSILWSKLAENKRLSLALLEYVKPGTVPYVYSGRDGRVYEFVWSRSKESLPAVGAGIETRRAALARGEFGADVSQYKCDQCRVRASCPGWIGAVC